MGKPLVHVCYDSSCREDHKALGKLLAALDGEATVERVRCQKICEGPVAGTDVDGTLEWFEGLDSGKRRAAFLELVVTGKVPRRLSKRRAKNRLGKLRT